MVKSKLKSQKENRTSMPDFFKKLLFLVALILSANACLNAADYKFTYKKGKVTVAGKTITAGKDSAFAITWGAACEVRCGAGSVLKILTLEKTAGSVFELKKGACFARVVDDGSGASVRIEALFASFQTASGAVYLGYEDKTLWVYDGSARVTFGKKFIKLTQGKKFQEGVVSEVPGFVADPFREWAFKRDKTDMVLRMKIDGVSAPDAPIILKDALAKTYQAGNIEIKEEFLPGELMVETKLEPIQAGLRFWGVVMSDLFHSGVIDLSKSIEKPGQPYEGQALMVLMFSAADSIKKILDQEEVYVMKGSRKVVIVADDLSNTQVAAVRKVIENMPGFVEIHSEINDKNKVVFNTMQACTGYDIAEALMASAIKNEINIWKYSKNIVKLRVVKVEQ
jgi:hypothetical protein